MKKRHTPETSHAAYEKAKPMMNSHYEKIMGALLKMGSGTAEEIGNYLGMSHSQVNRRVSEMEKLEKIYRPGNTKKTSTGREAKVWTIRGDKQPKTDNETKNLYANGQRSAAEFASDVIQLTQAKLFT